jgi:S1-C subfamily serine protease
MRRGFYSSASAPRQSGVSTNEPPPLPPAETKEVAAPAPGAWRKHYRRHEKALLVLAGGVIAVALFAAHVTIAPPAPMITQDDIDQAVARTLETRPLPSPAVKAYNAVRSSLVRIRAMSGEANGHEESAPRAVGSGVVIVDRGVILTSLHVVAGSTRILVQFENGMEAEASVTSVQPEHDLAVLQAKQIPDDLRAATLRSAKQLTEGEHVTAIGFPFGIGPSVSHGVISGLKREYVAPGGTQRLSDLIQFDAAANPGSSGGPLVNAMGEVIGIVTAILSERGTFAGVAFAVPIETAAGAAGLPPF